MSDFNLNQINIQESLTKDDFIAIYPVIYQLRNNLNFDMFIKFLTLAKQDGYRIFYASYKKSIVGIIGMRVQNDLCWGHHLYVDDLVVDKDFRNKKIGTKLMKFAEEFAYNEKCQCIRLASGISRIEAHKFYEQLKYRKTSFTFALNLKYP
jgi:GNAT superfamily N-acetyltransferase